jgi:hypothetical protein
VEFLAIGAAVKKIPGVAVSNPALPIHAIVPDRETWI